MRPTISQLYARAQDKIQRQAIKIEYLEERIKQLEDEADRDTEADEVFVDEDFFDPSDMMDFLEDIGIDPYDLPSSVGERMAIRDLLQAAKAVR